MKKHWRFTVLVILLGGTAALLAARSGSEIIAARPPLASFPHQLGEWSGTDIPLEKGVLDVLGPGDFLVRDYRSHQSGSVALFIAYFPSQRAGDTIHSPKNCLPGAGWVPVQASRIEVNVPGHASFPANRYLIQKGDERELVLYWYWAHNRALADEYAAKFYLVVDSIRMHRSDGSLVRLSTPLDPGESVATAQSQLLSFAGNVVPLMNTYVPR